MNKVAVVRQQRQQPTSGSKSWSNLFQVAVVLKGTLSRWDAKGGKSPYHRFRKDPYYLLRYYIATILVLGVASVVTEISNNRFGTLPMPAAWMIGLILFVLPSFSLIFTSGLYYVILFAVFQPTAISIPSLALVPAGILAGTVSAAMMHNAAHGNFRYDWQNRFWGELCGLFQLTGFVGWCISHFIHHAAPDNPNKDAHPPGDMTFRGYVNAMGQMMKASLTERYFEAFGSTPGASVAWSMINALLPLVRYFRVAFIFLLLGPSVFVLLYVPFKMTNTLIYADFNYRTHRPTGDGGFEILNLNHNLWYKLLNAISFGSYFHKNHHRKANVFNPRFAGDDDVPLVTFHR